MRVTTIDGWAVDGVPVADVLVDTDIVDEPPDRRIGRLDGEATMAGITDVIDGVGDTTR